MGVLCFLWVFNFLFKYNIKNYNLVLSKGFIQYDPKIDPNVDPNVDPNADPNVDPNVDSNLDPNVDPNFDPNFDLDFGLWPNSSYFHFECFNIAIY
jgi:hypothetical protein